MYLVDAFTIYAASALASNAVLRSILGAVLPLAAPSMYDRLGLGWGNSLLGFIALVMVPAPLGRAAVRGVFADALRHQGSVRGNVCMSGEKWFFLWCIGAGGMVAGVVMFFTIGHLRRIDSVRGHFRDVSFCMMDRLLRL